MKYALGAFPWLALGMLIAGILAFQLNYFAPPNTARPGERWTTELREEVQTKHIGGFFRNDYDYYVCEPKPIGYNANGEVQADYVNKAWVIYRTNHDKFFTDKGCW